jgi:polygalacturonase
MPGSIRIINANSDISSIPLDNGRVTIEGGVVARTLADRFGEVVNVKDFGAVGDGITDDTISINNAASSLTSGGIVFIPSGTYIVSSIKLLTDTIFIGEGDSTIIKLKNGVNQNIFSKLDDHSKRWGIKNLRIHGNKSNNTSGHGIYIYQGTTFEINGDNEDHGIVSSVHIRECAQDGVMVDGPGTVSGSYYNIRGARFDDIVLRLNGRDGFNATNLTDAVLRNVVSSGNSRYGIRMFNCANLHVYDVKTYYNCYGSASYEGGIYLNTVKRSGFFQVEAQEEYTNGIYADSCSDVDFAQFIADSNGRITAEVPGFVPGIGVHLVNCSNMRLTGNVTSFHYPSWQDVGLKITSSNYISAEIIASNQITSNYTYVSGTYPEVIVNGVRQAGVSAPFRQAQNNARYEMMTFDDGAGGASVDWDAYTSNISGRAQIRLFRRTNSNLTSIFQVYKGNNTATVATQMASDGNFESFISGSGYISRTANGSRLKANFDDESRPQVTNVVTLNKITSACQELPNTFTSSSSAGNPGTNQVTIAGGNIKIGRTSDATNNEVVRGNDTRLTNSRTPSSHASTHSVTGSDPITIEQSQVVNLVTDLSNKVDKSNSPIYVDDYGAIGDGVTDDTAAVQAAISSAPVGSTIKFGSDKHYFLKSIGTITKPLTIDGNGCQVTCDITPISGSADGSPLFSFSGEFGTTYNISAANSGVTTIQVANVSAAGTFVSGDIVLLSSTDNVPKWDGSGIAFAGIYELHRVQSSNGVTGEIELSDPIENSMINVTIRKIDALSSPKVCNFSRIVEVDPNATTSAGYGPNAPNIIDFYGCNLPICQNVNVIGFNLNLCNISMCHGAIIEAVRGESAYKQTNGGHGNVVKSWYSRNVRITNCTGLNIRHLVDWVMCFDGVSEYCSSTNFNSDANAGAFITHGYLSKRITSLFDSSINGFGWGAGNIQYAYDSDIKIFGFRCNNTYNSRSGIAIGYKTSNVVLEQCNISGPDPLRVLCGASNVKVSNCQINSMGYSGKNAVAVYTSASENVSGFSIFDSIVTSDSSSGSVAIYVDCEGDISISRNKVYGRRGIRTNDTLSSSSLVVDGNIVTTDPNEYQPILLCLNNNTPRNSYRVSNNYISGIPLGEGIYLNATPFLQCYGNRASEISNCITFGGEGSQISTVVASGGMIQNNFDSSDVPSSIGLHRIQANAGSNGYVQWARSTNLRWAAGVDNLAESGNNAGSNWELVSYDDNGNYLDTPLEITRPTSGAINFSRPYTGYGTSVMTQNAILDVKAAAGYAKQVNFSTGTASRWSFQCNGETESGSGAGSNFEIQARADNGTYVDTPFKLVRAANGAISLSRPYIGVGYSTLAQSATLDIKAAAGQNKQITLTTGTSTRWTIRSNTDTESGSDSGSAFEINARADNGTSIDVPFKIIRAANGPVTVSRPIVTQHAMTVKLNSVTSSATTTAISGNDYCVVVTGSTTHTLTLPAASTGRQLILKNRSSGNVTVNRAGSDTIDGGTSFTLTENQSTVLVANGTDWCRVANA